MLIKLACVRNSGIMNNGSTWSYHRLRKNLGLKVCVRGTEKERDLAYRIQRIAAKKKIGPRAYGKVTVESGGETYYGYITEHAERCTKDDYIADDFISFIDHLFKTYRVCDNGYNNVGRINGRLVFLDFEYWDWKLILGEEE